MKVYVVVQSGAYRHDIGGVYTDLDDALGSAARLLKQEPDSYHSWEIAEVCLNGEQPEKKLGEVAWRIGNSPKRGHRPSGQQRPSDAVPVFFENKEYADYREEPLTELQKFAISVLEEDPVACDAVRDIVGV